MTLIAHFNFGPITQSGRKNMARYMSKKSRFKGPFDRQHGKFGTKSSQKQKAFSRFFLEFLKSPLNLETFQKKDDPQS